MELTLGPIYYNWKRDEILKFYKEVSCWPVDRVYLGEVVCSMKREISLDDLSKISKELIQSGKEVVISGLALISSESDLDLLRAVFDLPYPVEANDMSVFNINGGREVIAGPHIATYNTPSIEFLQKHHGVKRVVFPVELSKAAIGHILSGTAVDGEVVAYGKIPLAYSWRCYTLRHFGLSKASCRNNCKAYPEGIPVRTVTDQSIFTINGTQVLSGPVYSLLEYVDELQEIGIKALRVSPEYGTTGDVVKIFRERMDGKLSGNDAADELQKTLKSQLCNGWYHGQEGIALLREQLL